MDRKEFLKLGGFATLSLPMASVFSALRLESKSTPDLFFDISLAQWSLHRALNNGDLDHLDFSATAKNDFGINAVEYVSVFFQDKVEDISYLDEMNKRCDDLGVRQLLIMVDGEGGLAVSDNLARMQAVENHYKWVEAAKYLGCHSIRVNAYGDGTAEQQKQAAIDGLGKLAEFAQDYSINVIVENHGGYSSNGQWLSEVMKHIGMKNCGTLPDFGNFCVKRDDGSRWGGECVEEYDRYKGVEEMMPFAKAVSAKSYAFNDDGEENTIDYSKMLSIINDAGFTGHIGIEYEGNELSEFDGIKATKKLLTEAGSKLNEG